MSRFYLISRYFVCVCVCVCVYSCVGTHAHMQEEMEWGRERTIKLKIGMNNRDGNYIYFPSRY